MMLAIQGLSKSHGDSSTHDWVDLLVESSSAPVVTSGAFEDRLTGAAHSCAEASSNPASVVDLQVEVERDESMVPTGAAQPQSVRPGVLRERPPKRSSQSISDGGTLDSEAEVESEVTDDLD
jgi:hypothetical protein